MSKNFDANASLGLIPEISTILPKYFSSCLNPSSIHKGGQKARALVEEARESIVHLLDAKNYRVIFTSGATESCNTALWQAYFKKFEIVTTPIEHPCILQAVNFLKKFDVKNELISVDNVLENDFNQQSKFYSLMAANNETGYKFDLESIASKIKSNSSNSLIHSDFVQVLGKENYYLRSNLIDFVSISAHKIGGLQGVGALLVREDFELKPLIYGGSQQLYLRAGTENVLGIISFGLACKFWLENGDKLKFKIKNQKNRIEKYIKENINDFYFNNPSDGLGNTISLSIPGINADDLVVAMDLKGYNISSGAACSSGKPTPSHVLLALGLSQDLAKSTIRISLSPTLDDSDVENFCIDLKRCIEKFKVGHNE